MKHISVTIALCLFVSGCAIGPAPIRRFISPSQADYDRANSYFNQKDYDAAIAAYEKFIQDYPRHKLIPGAWLGITWSYYLKGEYDKSLQAQAKVRTKDEALKAWLDKLANACKARLAKTAAISAPRFFSIPPFTNKSTLEIEGTLPKGSTVSINEIMVSVQDGLFSQEISLEEGENLIKIEIIDKDGNTEIKESKVVLDTTSPHIEVVDAELDRLGYVTISGVTEENSIITANGEELFVSAEGEFEGKVKLPHNLELKLVAEDRAGNVAKTVFSDTEYPDRPTGLRLRAVYGDSVDLEWNENPEVDIKGYNIYYSLAGDFSDQPYNTELIEETISTMVGLGSGNTYSIYLRAVDKMGNESLPSWETLSATIP